MKKVVVVGAGVMGNGIAHAFALSGSAVWLIDASKPALEIAVKTIAANMARQVAKGAIGAEDQTRALASITPVLSIRESAADADLFIEAITERLEVKTQVFATLDQFAAPASILASNTSSISITQIASATARPNKVIGMHFMNPAPVMQLVEIIRGYRTSDNTCRTVVGWTHALGKVPIEANDYPGFVANRILMPMINEAIYTLQEGVAGVYEIDTVMKLGMAHPMGPLRLADFIGLDVCLSILEVLHRGIGQPKYAPCPLLVNMVMAGHQGVKAGVGFYDYRANPKEPAVAKRFTK